MARKSALLDNATNMFGSMGRSYRAKVSAFLAAPTVDGWDEISGIIVSRNGRGGGTSVWQAVIAVAPTFANITKPYVWSPTRGTPPAVERWSTFPDAFTVARAIREATKGGGAT